MDLEKVHRIMRGQTTYQFQKWSSIYGDATDKSFSILFLDEDNQERTLDLIAPAPDVFLLWYCGLTALVEKFKKQRENISLDALYLKALWDRADKDHSGTLNAKEITRLVASMNINTSQDKIIEIYKKYDVDQNGVLDFNEFIGFISFLKKRPDIEAIWDAIVSGKSLANSMEPLVVEMEDFPSRDAVISLEQFIRFWYVNFSFVRLSFFHNNLLL